MRLSVTLTACFSQVFLIQKSLLWCLAMESSVAEWDVELCHEKSNQEIESPLSRFHSATSLS